MSAKHTPGPWEAVSERLHGTSSVAGRSPEVVKVGRKIAKVQRSLDASIKGGRCEEAEANARLIAAAPELLDALQRVVAQLRKRECSIADCKAPRRGRRGPVESKGRSMSAASVSPEVLREWFVYEAETGLIYWKASPSIAVSAGDEAGTAGTRGYRVVRLRGSRLRVHRVIWALHTGAWPKHTIDHIDGDNENNRITNLRDVENRVNAQNKRRARKDNQTGVLGVTKNRSKYRAVVCLNGRNHCAGIFDTIEEARAAYVEAKRRLHHEGNTL
jgi:hypothetical protein